MIAANPSSDDNGPSTPIPHVLHVVGTDTIARFGRMFRQLGIALADEGVRVSLMTDDAEAAAELDGTPISDCFFRPLRGWGVWRIHGYLRRQFDPPPDIVHLWGADCLGYLSDWTLHGGAALVIHLTALEEIERVMRRGLRVNETIVAGCDGFGELLRERWPIHSGSVRVLKPALLPPEQVRELSVRGRTLGVVWAGEMRKGCGLEVLIEAAARLVSKDCDLQIALIGRGPETGRYWHEIMRQGVAGSFSLVAEPRIWDRAIPGADVCVVPASQHDLMLAPLLAMACGKVVIASRDQTAEWFLEDQNCLQFTPGSAVELAYHLTRVAVAHPNALAVARAAAAYAREHHAVTRLAADLASLYHELCSVPAKRSRTISVGART